MQLGKHSFETISDDMKLKLRTLCVFVSKLQFTKTHLVILNCIQSTGLIYPIHVSVGVSLVLATVVGEAHPQRALLN